MKKALLSGRTRTQVAALLLTFFLGAFSFTTQAQRVNQSSDVNEQLIRSTLKKNAETVRFIQNKGQIKNSQVKYYYEGQNGAIYVEQNEIRFVAKDVDFVEQPVAENSGLTQMVPNVKGTHTFSIQFAGARANSKIELGESYTTSYNYMLGEQSEWVNGVKAAKELTIRGVYEGIDLRLYSSADGKVEFDWIVAAGADFSKVDMKFTGQNQLEIDPTGALKVGLQFTDIHMNIPESYQVTPTGKVEVNLAFNKKSANEITFEALSAIDSRYPLIIDPILSWGTFVDGNDADFDQYLFAIQVDPATGFVYCAGGTNRAFTTGSAPYDADGYLNNVTGFGTGATPRVAVLYRINASGSDLLDLTLYGPSTVTSSGTTTNVIAYSMSLSNNNVFIGGLTNSDLPGVGAGSFDSSRSSRDGFVASFTKDLGSLNYATYIGGSSDETRGVMSIRALSDNSFIIGSTMAGALNSTYVPTGMADSSHGGGQEMYIAKFTSNSTLAWGTYVGGGDDDICNDIEVFADGRVAFAGYGNSSLTETNSAAGRSTNTGNNDGFIGIISANGTSFTYLDEIGGSNDDQILDLEIIGSTLYFTGYAESGFPTSSGAYDTSHNGGDDAIVGSVSTSGTNYKCTFYGGSGDEIGNGIKQVNQTDCDGNTNSFLLVFGTTGTSGSGLPTQNLNSESFFDSSNNGGLDMFFGGFKGDLTGPLVYGTYIGGEENDYLGDTGSPRGSNHLWVNGANVYVGTTTHNAAHTPAIVGNGGFDTVKTNNEDPAFDDTHVVFAVQFAAILGSDFGDAPSSYGAAAHVLDCANLYIGTLVDDEASAQSSANANGDNTLDANDEDGIVDLPVIISGTGQSFSVNVTSVKNTTANNATLYGWIDFNGNGSFEASEFTSVSVAAGFNGAKTLSWSGITVTGNGGNHFLRIRLTSDALVDNAGTTNVDERSTTQASNGEVEDYRCTGLTCPTPSVQAACQTQSAINAAFDAWKATATAGGPCSGTLSSSTGSAPNVCTGGTTTITYTYTSSCEETITCSSTFTVTAPSAVSVNAPAAVSLNACMTQSEINTAYNNWLASASANGGCNGVLTNNSTGAPQVCTGGSVTVTWSYASSCTSTITAQSTFAVAAPVAISLTCPVATTTDGCLTQTAANSLYLSWLNSASAIGGCNGVITHNGGSTAPNVVSGGTKTVTFTYTTSCGTTTCQSTFTVPAITYTCPANASIACDAVPSPSVTGTPVSTCSSDVWSYTDSNCNINACQKQICRHWTSTLGFSCDQVISLTDDVKPTLIGTPDANISVVCYSQVPTAANVTANDNCNNNIEVQYSQNETNLGSSCNNTITRTWTATDPCGNTQTFTQTIVVNDNVKPILFDLPSSTASVTCYDMLPAVADVKATDNCGFVDVEMIQTETQTGSSCNNIVTRTWTATDNCGNSESFVQTITVNDNINPVLNGLPIEASVVLGCYNDLPAAPSVTATDNCSNNLVVDYDQVESNPGSSCDNVITRTWSVEDACGNSASFTQTFTINVEGTPAFDSTPVASLSFDCYANVPAAEVLTATSSCGNTEVTFNEEQSNPGSSCNNVITRTWTAENLCGVTSTFVQTITVNDNIDPVLVGTPAAVVQINCIDDLPAVADVTAIDNCGAYPVQYSVLESNPGSSCDNVITRTWTVEDACGNEASFYQTIYLNDNINPVLNGLPIEASVVLGCYNDLPAAPSVTASDNCSNNLVVDYDQVESNPGSSCDNVITRTWSVEDACGNSASFTQTFTINVEGTPAFDSTPVASLSFDCYANVPAAEVLTATSSCGNTEVSFDEVQSNPGSSCNNVITRTWTAENLCGVTSTFVQTITVNDNIDPVLVGTPAAVVQINCIDDLPAVADVTAIDNCGAYPVQYSVLESNPGSSCDNVITRTWTVEDACGNEASFYQTIYLNDNINPVLNGLPIEASVVLGCYNDLPAAPSVTASDNCSNNLVVDYDQVESNPGSSCDNVITRTWSVEDACGNSASFTQTFTINVEGTPAFDSTPVASLSFDCYANVPAAEVLTATSSCGNTEVSFDEVQSNPGSSCNNVITRTWTAENLCGVTSTFVQTITVNDNIDPVLVGTPAAVVQINCIDDLPAVADVTAIDNCGAYPVQYSVLESNPGSSCDNVITRTWTVEDACGNEASFSQTIYLNDNINPVLNGLPIEASVVLGCYNDLPAAPSVTASDNCSNNLVVDYDQVESNPGSSCDNVITRTWSVEDACGNSASFTQTFTINVEGTPAFDSTPVASLSFDCYANVPAAEVLTATSSCGNTEVSFDEEQSNFGSSCNNVITRTWTAENVCGVTSTFVQTITVNDNIDPVLVGTPEMAQVSVNCIADVPAVAEVMAMDNCSDVEVEFVQTETNPGSACFNVITRTWSVEDACGNSASFTQTITIQDNIAPFVVSGEENVMIECGNEELIPSIQVADNCGIAAFDYNDANFTQVGCFRSFTRVYTFEDYCGNIGTFNQNVEIDDNTAPTINGVEEVITVQCVDEIPGPAEAYATDNCDETVELDIFGSFTGNMTNECVLSTAFGPGADWAFWVPDLYSAGITASSNFHFDSNGGRFDQFGDGTAHLYGTVQNSVNATQKFNLDLWFDNAKNWNDWSAMGRGYKDDVNCATPTGAYEDWTYYEMVNDLSIAVGQDALSGTNLNLTHAPSNYYFGFQIGQGANNKNCNYGLSGWFNYTGIHNCAPISGHGDVNTDAACEPVNLSECVNNTSYTYVYRASDSAGNITTLVQTINVEDTTAPTFDNCPSNITVSCDETLPTLPVMTATDNCSGDVIVEYLGEIVEGNSCNRTITRTWSATDLCNNRAMCTQVITVVDTIAPQFSAIPEAVINASCDNVPAALVLTATDNCDNGSEVGFYEETIPGNCPGNYTLIRTWSTSDICGNSNSVSQTVNVTDITGPVFATYQIYTQVNCEDIAEYTLTASDACGSATVEITFEQLNSGGCLGVLHRIYTATDLCGNVTTAEQYITIIDITGPAIEGVGETMTVQCSDVELGENGYFGMGNVTATDNCGGEVTLTYNEEVVANDDNCINSYDIIRTWTAIDYCDNVSTASQTVHVVDTTQPWFEYVPADTTISCESGYPVIEMAVATDNCDDNVYVAVADEVIPGDCPSNYTVQRIYRAFDNCGNSAIAVQMINVADMEGPQFDEASVSQLTFECGQPIAGIDPIVSDNCSEFTVSVQDTLYYESECFVSGAFVYTAIDACGNESMFFQYYTIEDTTAPAFADYAHEMDMPCDNYEGIFVEATDVCNEVEITYEDQHFSGGYCAGIVIRTYTATDFCGNSATAQQIIRLVDEVDPVIEFVSENFEVQCGSEYGVVAPIFSDNCDNNLDITSDIVEGGTPCARTMTYTWTATDHCGNSTTATTVVTIVDTMDPYFTTELENYSISCEAAYPAFAEVSASDVCDSQVEIAVADSIVAGDCPSNYTIVRTYTATDDCGNTSELVQYINVADTQAPSFDENAVSELTFQCGDIIEGVQPAASDICSEFTISVQDTMYYDTPCYKVGAFIYTAIDACGNESYFYQSYTVIDTIAPVFADFAHEIDMPCDNYEGIFVEASDLCNEVEITYADEHFSGGYCAGIIIRTYTATDLCGNSETAQQIIRLVDEVDPMASNITADFTVECGTEYEVSAPSFSDNCDNNLEITSDVTEAGEGCERTITYTWTAIDHCDNATTVTTIVTIVDNADPMFTFVPESFTAECSDTLTFASAEAWDLCDLSVSITETVDTIAGNCPGSYSIVRNFTATDDCGNFATDSQVITIEDNTAPSFDFVPEGGLVYCGVYGGYEMALASDLCSGAEVSYIESSEQTTVEVDGEMVCAEHVTVMWTATDLCGNFANATTHLYIYDNVAPYFNGQVGNVTVACASDIPALVDLTATDVCGDATVTRTIVPLSEVDNCGNQQFRVEYVAEDECGNMAMTSYVVTVDDNIEPVFSSLPQDLTIACTDAIPTAIELTATDNCGGEVEVSMIETYIGEQPAEGSIADCDLMTPSLGNNSCSYMHPWAMILFGVPSAHQYYVVQNGELVTYPNNTMHLVADLVNYENNANGFHVDVEFVNGMDWNDWSSQSFFTGYKADCGSSVDAANHTDWMYYIMNNQSATMSGFGAYEGSTINLAHAPVSKYFAFQLGDGANNLSDSENGFGGWFSFSGNLMYNGSSLTGSNFAGSGDFAFDLDCCPDYYVSRCYTAMDCSGNVAQHCQNIYFDGTTAPQPGIINNPVVEVAAKPSVEVYPNPAATFTQFKVKAAYSGPAVLEIFDVTGNKIAELMNTRVKSQDETTIFFDTNKLSSGIYTYRFVNGQTPVMGRVIVSK